MLVFGALLATYAILRTVIAAKINSDSTLPLMLSSGLGFFNRIYGTAQKRSEVPSR